MGTRNLIQYSTIPNPIPVPVESTPEKNKRLDMKVRFRRSSYNFLSFFKYGKKNGFMTVKQLEQL